MLSDVVYTVKLSDGGSRLLVYTVGDHFRHIINENVYAGRGRT